MRIEDAAIEVMREQERPRVWRGDPNLLHDIADRAACRQRHPINVAATILSCISRSAKFQRVGFIRHMGHKFPVFEPATRQSGNGVIPGGYRIDPVNGIVYGKRGKPIAGRDNMGYPRVMSNGHFIGHVHRLVWESVNGPIPSGLVINHINGIKHDNRIVNLELVTVAENNAHARRTNLNCSFGEKHAHAKLKESDVVSIRERLASGERREHIAKLFGVSQATITGIKTGRRWSHVA